MLRLALAGVAYALTVAGMAVSACLSPAYALVPPVTAWQRVVQAADAVSLKAAQKIAVSDLIAAAAVVPTPVGLGVKALALGLTIGVPLGLALWETYYPAAKLAAIQAAATQPQGNLLAGGSNISVPNGRVGNCPTTLTLNWTNSLGGAQSDLFTCGTAGTSLAIVSQPGNTPIVIPAGWSDTGQRAGGQQLYPGYPYETQYVGVTRAGTNQWTASTGGMPTQAQASAYIQALPATDPNAIESNTTNQGVGATAPTHEAGTQVVTIVTNIDNSTHVVQTPAPGDVVVNPSVPAPAQTTVTNNTTNNNTSTVTTTTTTTTNPNGSVTTVATSSDTQASVSPCVTPGHQTETLGSILAKHQAAWKTSGLLSTLTALKALVFAGSPPVISLPTHLFGTFTVDFGSSTWAFVFTAMQSIFLALAGLVSVRIVFGRG